MYTWAMKRIVSASISFSDLNMNSLVNSLLFNFTLLVSFGISPPLLCILDRLASLLESALSRFILEISYTLYIYAYKHIYTCMYTYYPNICICGVEIVLIETYPPPLFLQYLIFTIYSCIFIYYMFFLFHHINMLTYMYTNILVIYIHNLF